jgi:glycosyltransferase involved in cell wall biosynthesis
MSFDERKNNPFLISVITVVYNRAHEIEDTIKSTLGQQCTDCEYIIVDGGSKDGTVEIIKRYAEKINQWVSEPDKGIYDAMNKAIRMASGNWIIFMNGGDLFYNKQVLNKVLPTLKDATDYLIVYGDAEVVAGENRHIQYQRDRHLDLTKSIIHQAMFIRADYLRDNPYDKTYRVMADYDNLLKVSAKSPERCLHVDEIICRYDKTGVSSRPLYTYFREYYALAKKHMSAGEFLKFNFYIFPRLIWSYRLALK